MKASEGEKLLRDLILGERAPMDPLVREAFARDPELLRRWEDAVETDRLLEGAAGLEAAVLGDSGPCSISDAPATGASVEVGRVLDELRAGKRQTGSWRWIAASVAAAGLIFVTGFLAWRRDPGLAHESEVAGVPGVGHELAPAEVFLGSEESAFALVQPTPGENGSELDRFLWTYAPPLDWEGSCQVVVYTPDGEEIARSPEILAPVQDQSWEWRPTTEDLNRLREAQSILWQVSSESVLGSVASSPMLEVRLSL